MRSSVLIAAGFVLAATTAAFAVPGAGQAWRPSLGIDWSLIASNGAKGAAMRHQSFLVQPGGPDGLGWAALTSDGAKLAGRRHPSGLVTLPDEDELDEAARVMPFLVDAIPATTTAISHSWAPGNWYDPEPNPSPQRSKGPAQPGPVSLLEGILCAASATASDEKALPSSLDRSVLRAVREHYVQAARSFEITDTQVGVPVPVDGLIAAAEAHMRDLPTYLVMNEYAACLLHYEGNV